MQKNSELYLFFLRHLFIEKDFDKISMNDNLLPKIAHLVGNLVDFEKYVRNHQDTLLISKVFQSKSQYTESRNILNKF